MMLVVIGILVVITLAGARLLGLGWRGRKLNDHPTCGRCGFDLIGTVRPQLGVGSEVCPECGADLLERGMVQHGLRERRWVLIATGGVLFLTALLGWGGLALGHLSRVDWNTYKPAWVLEREATGETSGTKEVAVLGELMARRASGRVDAAMYRRLVDHAVSRQKDPLKQWQPAWGDLVEDARVRQDVSSELYQQYRVEGLRVALGLGERSDAAGTIPYVLTLYPGRLDSRFGSWLSIRMGRVRVVVEGDGDEVLVTECEGRAAMDGWAGGRASVGNDLSVAGVPAGRRNVTMTVDVHICQPGSGPTVATKQVQASGFVEFGGTGEKGIEEKVVQDGTSGIRMPPAPGRK